MTDLNMLLFAAINAPTDPSAASIALAEFFADRLIWIVPLGLVASWLWGREPLKRSALAAAFSGLLALAVAQLISINYYHARPFAIGVGHTFIPHVADSSFPSDHGTLMAAVGTSLLMRRQSRLLGCALLVCWFPMAWARVYLGVHFPADLVGAALVGAGAAVAVQRFDRVTVGPAYGPIKQVYRRVLRPLITRGWIQP